MLVDQSEKRRHATGVLKCQSMCTKSVSYNNNWGEMEALVVKSIEAFFKSTRSGFMERRSVGLDRLTRREVR